MVIILGLGFTGQRLARRLLRKGAPVLAVARDLSRFEALARAGVRLTDLYASAINLPEQAVVVHTIPPLPGPDNARLRITIEKMQPRRVVYVSSTGVYGDQVNVDADTPALPNDERGRRRIEEERSVGSGPWSSLILRSAAIYGPGRGVHAAIRAGKMPRGGAAGVTSRIHVEDLAAIVEAAVSSDLEGAWPVADDDPCRTLEIAEWCADFLRIDRIPIADDPAAPGRRVEGRKIREKLGIELTYSSWRTGIPASIEEETAEGNQAAGDVAANTLT